MTRLGDKGPDAYAMQVKVEKYLPGVEVHRSAVDSSVFHITATEGELTAALRNWARWDACVELQTRRGEHDHDDA